MKRRVSLSKRRIAQVLLLVVVVVFAVRESRILWYIEGLEIFDLASWGINISDEAYTAQNLFMFWGALIVLLLIRRWESPDVLSEHALKEKKKTSPKTSRKRKVRDKVPDKDDESDDPFGLINKKWKRVFPKTEET